MGKRGRGRAFWTRVVAEFESSSLRQEEFAAKRRISLGTFRCWLYRLRQEEHEVGGGGLASRFVEVLLITTSRAGISMTT